MTVNISCSGVLLRTSHVAGLAAPVEMEVVLPGDDEGSAGVIGHGSVRRAPRPGNDDHEVALSIDEYELVRTPTRTFTTKVTGPSSAR